MELAGATGHTDSAAVLTVASAEASALGDEKIGTEHILLAILESDCIASDVLKALGIVASSIRSALTAMGKVADQNVQAPSSAKLPVPDLG